MSKGEIAKKYFLSGKNCSQSVALAFLEELNLSEEEIEKLVIGFGGGFARQRLICGAVSGMAFVIGGVLSDGDDKGRIYAIIQLACERFKAELGSIICGELLAGNVKADTSPNPEPRTNEYYKKRPCADICAIAADITDAIIKEYK